MSSTNVPQGLSDNFGQRSDQGVQVPTVASDSTVLSSFSQHVGSIPVPDSSRSGQRVSLASGQVSSMASILSTSVESELGSVPASPISTLQGSAVEPTQSLPSVLSSPSWRLALEQTIQSSTSLPSFQLPDTPDNTPLESAEESPRQSMSVSAWLSTSTLSAPCVGSQLPPSLDSSVPMPTSPLYDLQGLMQGPPPFQASQVPMLGPSLPCVWGSPWVSQQGSAPPLSAPLTVALPSAPPSELSSPLVWVDTSAPPSDSSQWAVQGSVPPWAVPPFKPESRENFTQTMTDLDKPNITGHMFDVVVIGGGISGQFGSLIVA